MLGGFVPDSVSQYWTGSQKDANQNPGQESHLKPADEDSEQKTSTALPDGESNTNNLGNVNYLETRTKADDESPNNDEGHSSQSRDHHAAGKVLDTLKAQDNTGKSSQKAKDVTHARNEHPEDAEAVSREEADLTDDTIETVEKVDLEALDAVHSNPEQGAVTGSSSAHKQGKDSLLPPNTVPSTMHHPSQPQLNLEPKTYSLAGKGAKWKGVPLDDAAQRELDLDEDKQLNIGTENMRDEKVLENVKMTGEIEEQAAEGGMPGVRSVNSKVKAGNKLKGKLKYVTGKVTRNPQKIQDGKALMGQQAFEQGVA